MGVQRAHWVQQQAMKESGTLIRIHLDQEYLKLSRTLLPLGNPQRSRGPKRGFPRRSIQQIVDENTSGHGMFGPHTTRHGNGTGVCLLFDLFLNALLRLLDATGITHGIKRTP